MTQTLKQNTKALAMNKTSAFFLAALIVAAALFYVYFANVAVRTLTSLEKAKKEMQSLSVDVSEMESKRLIADNNLNAKSAKLLGLVEVSAPNFVVKNARKASLSLKID